MTDLSVIRDRLAQQREAGNFTPLMATLTLKPRNVRIDAVSTDGDQVFVLHGDGTREALTGEEIAGLVVL